MAINIRSNCHIEGIAVNNEIFKICQLADDTTLFLKNNKSLEYALNTLDKFYECTGLKLNRSKTEIFYLGNTNHRPMDNIYGIVVTKDMFKALGVYFCKNREEMVKVNLDKRLCNFKNALNMWSQRDLTMKGKIVILKTLAIPQLLYTTSVIYTPGAFVDKIDKAMSCFLWKNKPPKIKLSTVTAEIPYGGLKMPHFKTMIESQNVMWVKRLLSETQSKWKALAYSLMGVTTTELCSKMSTEYLNVQSPFYKQVLQSWYNVYSVRPSEENIINETLWNNRFILIGQRPAGKAYNEWLQKGIERIRDIIGIRGGFLTREEISAKYNIQPSVMSYNSLIDAIPKDWRKSLKRNNYPNKNNELNVESTLFMNKTSHKLSNLSSKLIYWHLHENFNEEPTSIKHWISEFSFLLDRHFEIFFKIPYRVVRDSRIQQFQYKILHKILACKETLFRWNIEGDDRCSFCDECETITHLLFKCDTIRTFWKQVEKWMSRNLGVSFPLSVTDVVFGIPFENNNTLLVINYIILYGKYHIYRSKLNNNYPFMLTFLAEIKGHRELERYIMTSNGLQIKFEEQEVHRTMTLSFQFE